MESRIIVTAELSQIRGHFTQISRVAFCVPLVNLSLALPFNHFLIFIYLILLIGQQNLNQHYLKKCNQNEII